MRLLARLLISSVAIGFGLSRYNHLVFVQPYYTEKDGRQISQEEKRKQTALEWGVDDIRKRN